jgi:hypothetical protein
MMKKPIAVAIGIPKAADEEEAPESGHDLEGMSETSEEEGKKNAAEEMIAAFHEKDPDALVEALEAFLDVCRPQEEEPEEE